MKLLVTGGLGFIGSAVVRHFAAVPGCEVLNVDACTYAGNPASVAAVAEYDSYRHLRIDIADAEAILDVFGQFKPDAVLHLAAESHVDRSIDGPGDFVHTNLVGTFTLLQAARQHWEGLDAAGREAFRFIHVSTDEVYGESIKHTSEKHKTESSILCPTNPYAATKAGAELIAQSYNHSFNMPIIITRGN
ncbi:MAG: GDP-mannose 4,6-dehydratase, partial [Gammaproteobacteria bacterium]|nr:GDP-mannose 4,6-dehydratase [Gammaproteobacteria bacterium]